MISLVACLNYTHAKDASAPKLTSKDARAPFKVYASAPKFMSKDARAFYASALGGGHSTRVRQEVRLKKIKDAQTSTGQQLFFFASLPIWDRKFEKKAPAT